MAIEYKRTLGLDSDGDFLRDIHDRYTMLDGVQAVVQELKITLMTIRGEDPFYPNHGLRLFDILGADDAVLEREIRTALSRDNRVEAVDEVEIDGDEQTRQREVSVTVTLVPPVAETVNFGVTLG